MLALSTAVGATGGFSHAVAQTTEPPAAQDRVAVDEIIVTARKREETIDRVPVAGSVVTGEQLENAVVDNIADYVKQIPAASLITSGPEYLAEISIRGQGVGRLGGSETATGIYRNGIFVAGGFFWRTIIYPHGLF